MSDKPEESAPHPSRCGEWVEFARRMIAYGETGADFIQRASAYAPTLPADLETVCRVWAAADDLDRDIGEALIEFDSALFDGKGELFTTRGVEPGAADNGEETLTYHCVGR